VTVCYKGRKLSLKDFSCDKSNTDYQMLQMLNTKQLLFLKKLHIYIERERVRERQGLAFT